jgi:ribose 1,5-bisphosphokinase PhnN
MDEPSGVGDKKILRLAAQSLGLAKTCEFVKRAIQFGTRVAKLSNEKFYGSGRKGKGQYKI